MAAELRSAFMLASLGCLTFAGLQGCDRLKGAAEEEIEKEARDRAGNADAGEIPAEQPVVPVDGHTLAINSVQPNRGEVAGGIPVEIVGSGFADDLRVFFGNHEVPPLLVDVLTKNRAQVELPAHAAGTVGVRIVLKDAATLLPRVFEYYDPVEITALVPEEGRAEGGTDVTVTGKGFVTGTRVTFGSMEPVNAVRLSTTALVLQTTSMPRGVYSVTVSNINGSATLPSAFKVFDPVRVIEVVPVTGPVNGGTAIKVVGTGFRNPTDLALGSEVQSPTPSADETELAATITLQEPAAEGPVAVKAENVNGSDELADGFVYYDHTNPDSRIIAVVPGTDLIAGGSEVLIVGMGFDNTPEPTFAKFGDTEATCSVIDDHQMKCTVPPGPEGPVTITVWNGAINVSKAAAFTYVDLQLKTVYPPDGAVAGGTYITITGKGFGDQAEVLFGTKAASDIQIAADGKTLTCYTPRGMPGIVGVRVDTRNVSVSDPNAFTYFEPDDNDNWSGGGPIDGSVNVTAYNGSRGGRIEKAFVMLGNAVDGDDHLSGYTDDRGQITLSGPGVFGPQDVHAAKLGYVQFPDDDPDDGPDGVNDHRRHFSSGFTWTQVDAQNLVAYLLPDPPEEQEPLPDCPDGQADGGYPPPGAPLVRGTISRIKDEFNTGDDMVMLTTTYFSFGVPLPNPGPNNQLQSQGPYELFTRYGDMVVIALAGKQDQQGFLDVHAMGFHPFLFTEKSSTAECETAQTCPTDEQCVDIGAATNYCLRVYDNVNITIDTPLKRKMEVQLKDAPLGVPLTATYAPPESSSIFVWYDFGHMGVYAMARENLDNSDTLTIDMPERLPDPIAATPFNVSGEVFGSSDTGGYTWSEAHASGLIDTSNVTLEPMLKAIREVTPTLGETLEEPVHLELELLPAEPSDILGPQAFIHYAYDVVMVPECLHPIFGPQGQSWTQFYWITLTGGEGRSLTLPVLPEDLTDAHLPKDESILWQGEGVYAPGMDYNNLNPDDLFGGVSRTGRGTRFMAPSAP